MTNLKSFVIANTLCIWMTAAPQIGSFEKQAISSAQGMSASDLDAALPNHPFASWFSQIIGPKAGVVWQLTECGEQIVAPGETGWDLPACAEVNANLPDGRKVFVVISVGTFKKGLTGKPTLFRAVIEQNERFHQVRRLSDLPEMLRAPDNLPDNRPATNMRNRIVNLPVIRAGPGRIIAPFRLAPLLSSGPPVTGGLGQEEAPPPPQAPEKVPESVQANAAGEFAAQASTQASEKVPESVSQSRAITRVKPAYPPTAKKMNVEGTVEVEITISEAGLVVEATAISGHFVLRRAAVAAARKWVFKPAILNGAPVRVKSVLTFVFAPSSK